MTWTKLGDEFFPEIADLSDGAALLHIKALGWSNWRLLDLIIQRKDLRKFAFIESMTVEDAIAELIDAGWWQELDDETYWIGCKFPEWQRDRVQVEHRRQQLAEAQRRKRRHELGDHSLCLASSRCKAASTVDRAVDSTVEQPDDPGRDGYGYGSGQSLEGKGASSSSSEPESWPSVAPPGSAQICRQCRRDQNGFTMIDGLCRSCRFDR